ncbi:GNAT family N-acetyltransferase [Microbacterium excoecariae]|uniref:GNAT family N-acetyltransferase n=1 Tax=Microbacterium excoecariae TaxID=2715210 RepID=UPI00140D8C8D
MTGVRVRAMRADEHEAFRAIRLRMLADAPTAFGERLADAERVPDAEWRIRATRMTRLGRAAVIAEDDDGWCGIMRGHYSPVRGPELVGVYVDPRARGRAAGVADRLLAEIVAWAIDMGGDTLTLDVHEHNARAIAFYRGRGFVPTGHTQPYPLDPTTREVEMRRALTTP